jgi:hypothetical protein
LARTSRQIVIIIIIILIVHRKSKNFHLSGMLRQKAGQFGIDPKQVTPAEVITSHQRRPQKKGNQSWNSEGHATRIVLLIVLLPASRVSPQNFSSGQVIRRRRTGHQYGLLRVSGTTRQPVIQLSHEDWTIDPLEILRSAL